MCKFFKIPAFCLPLFLCIGLISYAWLYYYEDPLIYDVEEYFIQIESGNITNWWSVLYMYECRWITDLLNTIPCVQLDGRAGMFVINVLGSILLCASFAMILKYAVYRSALWTLLYSTIMCATIPFLIYNGASYNSAYLGTLDYPGSCYLVFALVLSLRYRAGMGWKKFLILSFIIFFLMIHVVSFRKPFILFVPIIAVYAVLSGFQTISWRHCFRALCISIAITMGFYACSELPTLLPHRKRYPAQHMLMSDLKIASIFVGEPEYLEKKLMPKIQCKLITTDRRSPYAQYVFIGHNLIVTSPDIHNDKQWQVLCNEYIRYSVEHPVAMLEARAIKTIQFFTGNYVPLIVRKMFNKMHPQVKPEGLTYETFEWPENKSSLSGNIRRLMSAAIWVVGFAFPLALAWRHRDLFHSLQYRQTIRRVLYTGVCSFIAMSSYVAVIVATVDFRYRIPAVIVSVVALILWFDSRSLLGKIKLHQQN